MCAVCAFRVLVEENQETGELAAEARLAVNPPSSTGLRFEHYQVLTQESGMPIELGRGGMGVTYKAIDINLRSIVALKVINPRLTADEVIRRRFVREARAAASIRHPNVASVFHLGRAGDSYFYAMEFVQGEPLHQALSRVGRFEPPTALHVLTLVGTGLEAIAKQHLVHRDIKPGNIMISWEDDKITNAKIIDLGLAKGPPLEEDSAPDISSHGVFLGTPAYISPEQFAGHAADIRSDLYSLGITLWQMLSGKLPFQGSLSELNYQRRHSALPMEELPQVPQPVIALLGTLLQNDPDQRFQSPTELLLAIPKVTNAIESRRRLTADQLRPNTETVVLKKPAIRRRALPVLDNGKRPAWAWLLATLLIFAGLFATWFFWTGGSRFLTSFFSHPFADTAISQKSIAVLPFENLSGNPQDTYFADGVHDEILNSLAKISQLRVISRTSVMHYRGNSDLRQIANALSVTNVLEGTVRRAGNRVRVTTELVDAYSDNTIWADSYERELTDVFSIQSDIAQTVAAKLSARLSPSERKDIAAAPTSDSEAYDLYLRAKELVMNAELFSVGDQREDLLSAVTFLQEATRKDPRFVLAYCLAARAHDDLYVSFDDSTNRRALGDAAIEAATRIRPDLPDVHLATARHLYYAYRDYGKARLQIASVEKTFPNSSDALSLVAMIDRRQGRWDESTKGLHKAVSLDPRNPEIVTRLFENDLCLRRFRDAEDASTRLIEIESDKPGLSLKRAVCRFAEHADVAGYRKALDALPTSAKLDMGNTTDRIYFAALAHDWAAAKDALNSSQHQDLIFFFGTAVPRECVEIWLAMAQGEHPKMEGRFALAVAQLKQKLDADPNDAKLASALGIIDAALGRKDEAIQEAKRALELEPISKDAMEGPAHLYSLAVVYAQTGEPDLAFQALTLLAKTPSFWTNYGYFKCECGFQPLHNDPRFDQLLVQLAPRD